MLLARKFYFKSKADKIFIDKKDNINNIKKNIKLTIQNLENIITQNLKKEYINSYLYPLNNNKIFILKDFLSQIFTIDHKKRPTAKKLLNHELFTLI